MLSLLALQFAANSCVDVEAIGPAYICLVGGEEFKKTPFRLQSSQVIAPNNNPKNLHRVYRSYLLLKI
jgi:hypothetical protein